MKAITPFVAERFCLLCHHAYTAWQTWHALEPHDPEQIKPPNLSVAGARALRRLYRAIRDQAILQVVRLHDDATVSGKVTLTIDYVVQYGGWEESVGEVLREKQRKLNEFVFGHETSKRNDRLKLVRNQTLAHNDLAAVLVDAPVFLFRTGEDKAYFQVLEELTSVVNQEVCNAAYRFTDEAERDGAVLVKFLYEQAGGNVE